MDEVTASPSLASLKGDKAKPASRLTRSQAASTMAPQEALADNVDDRKNSRAETKPGTGRREAKRPVDVDEEYQATQGDKVKKRRRIKK
ncbi:hypothetical protein RhiJN_11924 [Ceratobasidium sp. AG-Ba]|nr:hypothetical protein RhiJN_11924 [Ceratobasidium sp. AG-Ba]